MPICGVWAGFCFNYTEAGAESFFCLNKSIARLSRKFIYLLVRSRIPAVTHTHDRHVRSCECRTEAGTKSFFGFNNSIARLSWKCIYFLVQSRNAAVTRTRDRRARRC
ncbi:hypothetical protein NDU88_001833 [Pleurodeles waltl]|uniref:Secreted protein n=1 Tax=Pleurodeles waltl TaxID=8319 RepID=A0AAV7Q9Y6_PLEWA|nr:hypothetical protein NDU88_001833 [Pleurodeles waltl]